MFSDLKCDLHIIEKLGQALFTRLSFFETMSHFKTDKILLIYLQGYSEFKESEEVPSSLTPTGIGKILDIHEIDLVPTLEIMEKKGLVNEEIKKVVGHDKEKSVYFLTDKGKQREENFWSKIKDKKITLREDGIEKKIDLKGLKHHISSRNPVARCLHKMNDDNIIDQNELQESSDVFVGRRDELRKLRDDLFRVKKEGAMILFIKGRAGIGKTSLVNKLKPFAKEIGFKFLSGTCLNDSSDPYLPLKEAFKELAVDEKNKYTSMAFIPSHVGKQIQDKKLFDAMKKETFFETTNYVKEMANDFPMVVFLDDLQWVDNATLNILAFMEKQLGDSPVLFICTYRPEEISKDHHLTSMMHRFVRQRRLNELELKPLNFENTMDIIKGELGIQDVPENFVDNIHQKTEGNPFFVKETIRQMQEEDLIDLERGRYPKKDEDISISKSIQNVVERRIAGFDSKTQKVVEYGGVIGGVISFELLQKLSDMDEIELLDRLDILITACGRREKTKRHSHSHKVW